jgi:hypothetical protein
VLGTDTINIVFAQLNLRLLSFSRMCFFLCSMAKTWVCLFIYFCTGFEFKGFVFARQAFYLLSQACSPGFDFLNAFCFLPNVTGVYIIVFVCFLLLRKLLG